MEALRTGEKNMLEIYFLSKQTKFHYFGLIRSMATFWFCSQF